MPDDLRKAAAKLFACPNWQNRIGEWADVNDAVRRLYDAFRAAPDRDDEAEELRRWTPEKERSVEWIENFAEEVGVSYAACMSAAAEKLEDGVSYCLDYDTPDAAYEKAQEFWEHYQIIVGKKVNHGGESFFRCAC
jgi:SAM-dependent MidA family methyltransferase